MLLHPSPQPPIPSPNFHQSNLKTRGAWGALQRYGKRWRTADLDETSSVLLHLAVPPKPFAHCLEYALSVLVGRRDDPIVHPLPFSSSLNDPSPAQIGEVPGDLRLSHLQYLDEETDADLVLSHQVDEPQPVPIGKRDKEFFEIEFAINSAHSANILT
jgi:hypothetical protein